jgi:hypothetical protein
LVFEPSSLREGSLLGSVGSVGSVGAVESSSDGGVVGSCGELLGGVSVDVSLSELPPLPVPGSGCVDGSGAGG